VEFRTSTTASEGFDQAGLDGWSAKVWGNASCSTLNTVSFVPGSDLITVEGSSTVDFAFRFWEYKFIGSNTDRTERQVIIGLAPVWTHINHKFKN
jgi:hypothetical protein